MDIEVMLVGDEHGAALAEFTREVWGPEPKSTGGDSAVGVLTNPYERESPSRSAIAVTGGRVIGHVTSTPCRVWCGGEEVVMHWCSGLHVFPEARGRGLAKLLVSKLMEVNPALYGVLVVEASRRANQSIGWTVDWKIPEYVKILDARGFIDRFTGRGLTSVPRAIRWAAPHVHGAARAVSGTVLAAANTAYQTAWRLGPAVPRLEVQQVGLFDLSIDELWVRNRSQLSCAQVRRSAYLNWAFRTDRGWMKLCCSAGGAALGYAIVAIRTFDESQALRGLTVATVVDLFWDFGRPEAARSLLGAAEDLAKEKGAQAVLGSGTDVRARRAFQRSGFIRIPGTAWYGFYSSNPAIRFPPKAQDWYANRGDADAAGSLGPTG
jgi:GNAT superfamily N-acetyltransferase